ncbi:MAG: sterol desaturase family protein [Pseudomonadota bacterium]
MTDFERLIVLEPMLRLSGFVLMIALLSWLQWQFPLRADPDRRRRSWTNLSLSLINTLILRAGFPMLAVAWAVDVYQRDGGLFEAWSVPLWANIPLAIVVLDVTIYWQHRLMHAVPMLWRLHRIHHVDRAMDLTTGVRFHPVEIMLSMSLKLALISLLGPHPVAVLVFELLLSLFALWTHTNVALPSSIDHRLRWVLVTPSMHRIHHSAWQPETDSNYGFHLSCWDRVFGSYRSRPRHNERRMRIGLDGFADDRDQGLLSLVLNPFRSKPRD